MYHRFGIALYGICLLFILSGALNYGITRWYLATPFMIAAVLLGWRSSVKRGVAKTLAICAAAVVVNLTLPFNPVVFPVLLGDVVLKTEYMNCKDASGNYTGPCTTLPVGTRLKARRVEFISDFINFVNVVTDVGSFRLDADEQISTDWPVETPLFKYAGHLMYYPAVPFLISKAMGTGADF